jgi:hypothetical protein
LLSEGLHATGEFVRLRSEQELREVFEKGVGQKISYRAKGNMAFVTTAMALS